MAEVVAERKRKSIYGCFHPRRVFNQYTQEYIVISCGKCAYCQMSRSAELSGRVNREMLNPNNGTCLFVTLTYRNEDLPVYTLCDEEETITDGVVGRFFHSNRYEKNPKRYVAINADDVDEYHVPVKWYDDNSFAHLCYEDVRVWLDGVYNQFSIDLKRKSTAVESRKNHILEKYEYSKFRYFLCGEYGPAGGRPHYHALVWFKLDFTEEQTEYVSQVLSKAWRFGNVYIKSVDSGNVSDYLASYVTSTHNLPEVLRAKSVRPFCTFSKFPTIGTIEVDNEKIRHILDTSTFKCDKFDKTVGEYVRTVEFPPSFFRRYFPKCTGFGYKDDTHKLRVYSYVFNYFKDKGIIHTADDVYNITLSDIEWPCRIVKDFCEAKARSRVKQKTVVFPFVNFDMELVEVEELVDVEEWDYRDKYAALVCYRYCVLFDYTPEYVIRCFIRLYAAMASDALGNLYDQQDEAMHYNTYYVQ